MKRRRHTPEQIIRKLRGADRLLAEGDDVPEVAKQLEVSEATYHRWRAQYGGLKVVCPRFGGVVLLDSMPLNPRGEWRGTTRVSAGVPPQGP
jgi:hypothetical protein